MERLDPSTRLDRFGETEGDAGASPGRMMKGSNFIPADAVFGEDPSEILDVEGRAGDTLATGYDRRQQMRRAVADQQENDARAGLLKAAPEACEEVTTAQLPAHCSPAAASTDGFS